MEAHRDVTHEFFLPFRGNSAPQKHRKSEEKPQNVDDEKHGNKTCFLAFDCLALSNHFEYCSGSFLSFVTAEFGV